MMFFRKRTDPDPCDQTDPRDQTKAQCNSKSLGPSSDDDAALAAAVAKSLQPRIEKLFRERLDNIEELLGQRLDMQDAYVGRLGKKVQLMLLEDGREIVCVPEHLEIRKAAKAK
jgi:hypothetical protein